MEECDVLELPYRIRSNKILINKSEPDWVEGEFNYIQITESEKSDTINRLLYNPIHSIVKDAATLSNYYGYSKYEICKANKRVLSIKYYVEFGFKGKDTITVNIDLNKEEEINLSQLGLEKKLYEKISKREYSVADYFRDSDNDTLFSLMEERGMTDKEFAELFKNSNKKFYLKNDIIGLIIYTGNLAGEVTLEFKYYDL